MNLEAALNGLTDRNWEPADGELRIAIVGVGGFARSHVLPAMRESDLCTATVLVSGSPERTEPLAAQYDAELLTYEQYRRGSSSGAYDAVYVVTPIATHLEHIEAAAELGKDILCEKAMEATVERAERVIDVCEKAGVTLMVAYRTQFDPPVRRIKALVDDGIIGDPVQFHSGFSSPIVARHGTDQWRLKPELAGGGAMINLGIYSTNTIRYLHGRDPISVTGSVTAPDSEDFGRVDEHVAFTMTFPDGATAACTASYNGHRDNRLQIVGTEGQVVIRPAFAVRSKAEFRIERADRSVTLSGPKTDEVAEELDYFATCVLTNSQPEPDGQHALTDVRIIEGVYESAESERHVTL